jgi:hypothetical protein
MRIMKRLIELVRNMSVAFATVGLLVPNVGYSAGLEASPATRVVETPATRIADVSLIDGGVLRGQILDGNGISQPNMPVTVFHGKDVMGTAVTNQRGEFAVQGMKGGVYVVATHGAANVIRAWAPRTAPPSAVASVLLVPDTQAVRAQMGGIVDQYGGAALLIGGMLAAIIWVVAEHNDDAS